MLLGSGSKLSLSFATDLYLGIENNALFRVKSYRVQGFLGRIVSKLPPHKTSSSATPDYNRHPPSLPSGSMTNLHRAYWQLPSRLKALGLCIVEKLSSTDCLQERSGPKVFLNMFLFVIKSLDFLKELQLCSMVNLEGRSNEVEASLNVRATILYTRSEGLFWLLYIALSVYCGSRLRSSVWLLEISLVPNIFVHSPKGHREQCRNGRRDFFTLSCLLQRAKEQQKPLL